MPNPRPTPVTHALPWRLPLALVLAAAALAGLPGRLADQDWLESLLPAPGLAATVLFVAAAGLLVATMIAAVVLEQSEGRNVPRAARFRSRAATSPPVLGVPLTLPSSVAAAAPGSHAVRLTYRPALAAPAMEGPHGIGLPVLAPAAGTILRAVDGHHDFHPAADWGNQVLMQLDDGAYLRLGSLACGSVAVRPGQHVRAGFLLAGCGCAQGSDASALLMQVQDDPREGATARPFRFSNFIEFAPAGPRWIEEAAPSPGAVIRGVRPIAA